MLKLLRSSLLLGLISLSLLFLIGASFTPCLIIHDDGCCSEDRDCNVPICDGSGSCHCACAFTGTPSLTFSAFVSLTPTHEVSSEASVEFSFDLPDCLYRPPRLA